MPKNNTENFNSSYDAESIKVFFCLEAVRKKAWYVYWRHR